MKEFFLKNKKIITGVALFWGILLILFFTNLTFSLIRTNNYADTITNADSTQTVKDNWNNLEIRNLEKDKLWLEQQLLLAKSDSFSLGINLKDSVVQVQLKGTVLFHAKILQQKPSRFFKGTDKFTYLRHFGEMAKIDSVFANVPKRPLKKVIAPPIGTEKETSKQDSVIVERINWFFYADNQIKVVINGVQQNPDSTLFIPVKKDMNNYRMKAAFENPFNREYVPTLFLWLNDAEAKAIYRALPDNARLIFRN